jgi:hypothetical protein
MRRQHQTKENPLAPGFDFFDCFSITLPRQSRTRNRFAPLFKGQRPRSAESNQL